VAVEPERGYGRADASPSVSRSSAGSPTLATIVTRGFAAHRVPWGNMYEFSTVVAFIVVSAFLVLLARQKAAARRFRAGAGRAVPRPRRHGALRQGRPLVPALNSYWLKIHVVAAMSATAMFFVSGHRRDPVPGEAAAAGRSAALAAPGCGSLDRLTYGLVAFAFPIWTFAIMAGAIWAEARGVATGLGPQGNLVVITWVIYAAYLHSRATAGWKGQAGRVLRRRGVQCADHQLLRGQHVHRRAAQLRRPEVRRSLRGHLWDGR